MRKAAQDNMVETDEIMEMIKKDGEKYFTQKENKVGIGIYLEQLMNERHITRKEFFRILNLEESYGRKLLGGQRVPTRKILIKCAFLLKLDLKETQRLLEMGQKARLYPRIRYDAALIHGIEKKMTIEEMNAFLEEIGEEPLL